MRLSGETLTAGAPNCWEHNSPYAWGGFGLGVLRRQGPSGRCGFTITTTEQAAATIKVLEALRWVVAFCLSLIYCCTRCAGLWCDELLQHELPPIAAERPSI